MTLIKSISGIRGTLGGKPGDTLSPIDIVRFTAAFGTWALKGSVHAGSRPVAVVGRDARVSGPMVDSLVCATLNGLGIDVINAGLATTPTVEMAVVKTGAVAGIIITASHNPSNWNALKLLNRRGEFISASDGEEVLSIAASADVEFAPVERLGTVAREDFLDYHIRRILELPEVRKEAIAAARLTIAVDAVNSAGGVAVPRLLEKLGVQKVIPLNCEPDGLFAHNPEPLPEHLGGLSEMVLSSGADLGIAVDPDVDRLALVCEDGSFFGEEYTLVAVAGYILPLKAGNTVSNFSSTRALRTVTEKYGGTWTGTPVGEVHVVEGMKRTGAVIGGEGNGGVIYPSLHYGRDALAGIALFLSALVTSGFRMKELRGSLPTAEMSKRKIELPAGTDISRILEGISARYEQFRPDRSDGVLIEFPGSWIHLRKSNTEPVIRIYSEAGTRTEAEGLGERIVKEVGDLVKNC